MAGAERGPAPLLAGNSVGTRAGALCLLGLAESSSSGQGSSDTRAPGTITQPAAGLSSPGEAGTKRCGCCSLSPTQSWGAPITHIVDPSAAPGLGSGTTWLSHHLYSHLQTTATTCHPPPQPRPGEPGGEPGGEQPLRCFPSHYRCSCSCHHSSGSA